MQVSCNHNVNVSDRFEFVRVSSSVVSSNGSLAGTTDAVNISVRTNPATLFIQLIQREPQLAHADAGRGSSSHHSLSRVDKLAKIIKGACAWKLRSQRLWKYHLLPFSCSLYDQALKARHQRASNSGNSPARVCRLLRSIVPCQSQITLGQYAVKTTHK